jgi:hypothetical protein
MKAATRKNKTRSVDGLANRRLIMAVAERTNEEKSLIGAFGRTFEAIINTSPILQNEQPQPVRSWPGADASSSDAIRPVPIWIEATVGSLVDLPWERDGWQQGAIATKKEAVSWLLIVLSVSLRPNSPVPVIGPMWDGGVVAEWHQNGIDIEIAVSPDGSMAWSFADFETGNEEEDEGNIVDKLQQIQTFKLREYVHRLVPLGG